MAKTKPVKRLPIIIIILISIVVPLLFTISYSSIESFCVHNGKDMPYQRDVWGGECREEVGLFWSVFYLEPMTSIDDPQPSYGPDINFSWKSFLRINVCCAFALWVILSLINRYFKTVIIVVGGLATVFLVFFAGKKIKKAWEDTPVGLESITVITSDVHPGIYNSMFYPHNTCYLVPAGEESRYGYLKNCYMSEKGYVQPRTISGKELRNIINAANTVKENSDTDYKKEFVYKVVVVYKTKSGYDSVKVTGYGDFPECWGDFINVVNSTCGIDYLREDPEPVRLTPDWFSETFGIYDDDFVEFSSVEEYLEKKKITMKNCSGMNASGDYFCIRPGDNNPALKSYYESPEN